MTPLLSVIIPAYNVADWITDCIESIVQTGGEHAPLLEIIVVDDGSTDNTPTLLDTIQQNYQQLTVIHQTNQGLSGSRNTGINTAKGRYIAFVDADDVWCDHIELPWEEMQEGIIEILGLDLLREEHNGKTSPYRRYKPDYGRIYSPAHTFLNGRNLFPCAVSYIVMRELLVRTGIRFTPGIFHEDEDYSSRLFLHAKSFKSIRGPHYIYKMREESITTETNPAKRKKRIADILWIIGHLQELNEEALRCKILFLAIDTLRILLSFDTDKDEIKATLHRLKELRLYPFPLYPNIHYSVLCLYLYLRLLLKKI